jgi:hypothetical protein
MEQLPNLCNLPIDIKTRIVEQVVATSDNSLQAAQTLTDLARTSKQYTFLRAALRKEPLSIDLARIFARKKEIARQKVVTCLSEAYHIAPAKYVERCNRDKAIIALYYNAYRNIQQRHINARESINHLYDDLNILIKIFIDTTDNQEKTRINNNITLDCFDALFELYIQVIKYDKGPLLRSYEGFPWRCKVTHSADVLLFKYINLPHGDSKRVQIKNLINKLYHEYGFFPRSIAYETHHKYIIKENEVLAKKMQAFLQSAYCSKDDFIFLKTVANVDHYYKSTISKEEFLLKSLGISILAFMPVAIAAVLYYKITDKSRYLFLSPVISLLIGTTGTTAFYILEKLQQKLYAYKLRKRGYTLEPDAILPK